MGDEETGTPLLRRGARHVPVVRRAKMGVRMAHVGVEGPQGRLVEGGRERRRHRRQELAGGVAAVEGADGHEDDRVQHREASQHCAPWVSAAAREERGAGARVGADLEAKVERAPLVKESLDRSSMSESGASTASVSATMLEERLLSDAGSLACRRTRS